MAVRRASLTEVFQKIYVREPALTSADVLLEFARRDPVARHYRPTRKDASDFLRPEGRYQVYKRVPVEWPGRISKPTETDVRFDLDLWDGRTQAPEAQAIKWVMLLQDRFSRKLFGIGVDSRQTDVLIDAFNTLLGRARADPFPDGPAEVNMDAESGFTAHAFRDALEAQGITIRVKRPGREEKQSLAQLDSAMATFKKALFRYQRQAGDDGWSNYIDDALAYVNRKPKPYGRGIPGNAPNDIEKSYEHDDGAHLFDSDAGEGDVSRVPAPPLRCSGMRPTTIASIRGFKPPRKKERKDAD